MAYPTGDRDTSVLLVEQRAPQQVAVGQSYQYELQVTNLTEEPLAGVTIVQNLGEQLDFEGSEAKSESSQQGQQRWKIGQLEAGESKTIRASAIPTEEGASGVCVAVLYEPAMCSIVEVVKPSLRLTKEGPERAYICEDVTYTYTVTNTGTGVAEDVEISDRLPNGLQTENGENEVRIQVGDLQAGQSQDFAVQLKPSETGVFASRALAESSAVSARSEEVPTEIIQADLRVNVAGPEWEYTDRPVTYEVEVTNVGKYAARDTVLAVVTNRMAGDQQARQEAQQQQGPAEGQQQQRAQQEQAQAQQQQQAQTEQQQRAQQQQAQAQQQQQAQQGQQQAQQQLAQRQQGQERWQQRQGQGEQDERRIGDLQPGETKRFNITLPGGTQSETIEVVAQATSICELDADEQAMDIAMTEIRTIPALLLEMVDNNDPVRIGDNTTYVITVKNQGTGIAKDVVITAELPQELEYISASGDSEVQSEGENEVKFQAVDLEPGDVAMWNVEAKANAPADIRMRVEMDSEYLARAVPEVEPTRLVESGD